MTIEDLNRIPGLTMLGEDDDLQEQEMGFRMSASVLAADGVFTEQVEIEVRCPQINSLILLNQATCFRLDGEDLPEEWSAQHIQKTLESIASSCRATRKIHANMGVDPAFSEAEAKRGEQEAIELIARGAQSLAPLGLPHFLKICGDAYLAATTTS